MAIAGRKINVLVVDDSAFMRKVVADLLNSDEEIKVIGSARDGMDAIKKFQMLKPDLITLDVEMPVMNGLVCIKEILKLSYVPILMISSHTKIGTDYTIEALQNGAVDFVSKPKNIMQMRSTQFRNELIEKIRIAINAKNIVKNENFSEEGKDYKIIDSAIKDSKRILKGLEKDKISNEKQESNNQVKKEINEQIAELKVLDKNKGIKKIIAIGASTGGPKALQSVIAKLPKNLEAAILIVQHMPAGFTSSLAERLDRNSQISVKEASDGEKLQMGMVYIAPGDFHMMVENHRHDLRIKLTKDPPIGKLRPAIDVLLQSLSDTGLKNIACIIMTGMGSDGSEGIKKLKILNDSYLIAQDEDSSTVFGMPKMAIQTGMIDKILALNDMPYEIIKIARRDN